jgi:chemotaxis protein MotB
MLNNTRTALSLSACAFLAACGVSQEKYDALQAQNQQLTAQNQQLQQQSAALASQNASLTNDVTRLQNAIKYTINSDLLFTPGSWQMSPQGQPVIAKFASQLAPEQKRAVIVTGFTDNAPIGPALKKAGITSNEMLSQKRAESVMAFLVTQGVKPNLVSARGLGEAQPIASNDTPAGRSQNRRVEITLATP